MYKLFLCLRYLTSRILPWLAVAAVALCVGLLVIVFSVMNGFLDKIETAAKGLFGDIVVSGTSRGIGRYDAFIEKVTREVDGVEAGSPFLAWGAFLRIPDDPDYQQDVQVVGIRLPERTAVTDFEKGLMVQTGSDEATWDPPAEEMIRAVRKHQQQCREIIARIRAEYGDGEIPPRSRQTIKRINQAIRWQEDAVQRLRIGAKTQEPVARLHEQVREALAASGGVWTEELDDLTARMEQLIGDLGFRPPNERAILGATLPALAFRTESGDLVRSFTPGQRVLLYIFPKPGPQEPLTSLEASVEELTVVDAARTGVYNIDNSIVYMPFETLQIAMRMDNPPRTSQIHFRVRADLSGEKELAAVAAAVRDAWAEFDNMHPDAALQPPSIRTWRQAQAHIIEPISAQRTLVVVMFGFISLVAVGLIFVVLYMIVLQKTKDIGVLKAVGASRTGVAGIFLAYGAVISLLGSIAGIGWGTLVVRNINPIHDWVGRATGIRIWSSETFMFDSIPNQVDWSATTGIIVGAIVAGVIGALAPSIRAGGMEPVEALRYE